MAALRTAAAEAAELGTAAAAGEAGRAAAAPCRLQVAAVVPTRQQIGHLGGWCLAINDFQGLLKAHFLTFPLILVTCFKRELNLPWLVFSAGLYRQESMDREKVVAERKKTRPIWIRR